MKYLQSAAIFTIHFITITITESHFIISMKFCHHSATHLSYQHTYTIQMVYATRHTRKIKKGTKKEMFQDVYGNLGNR